MSEIFDERDRRFLDLRKSNPSLTYAQYQTDIELASIRSGNDHATLGPRLRKHPDDWWAAGAHSFARLQRLSALRETDKVLEYGCGSLRVGGHFIRYLEPGHYFGLDVTDGFYEMGRELIGAEILRLKQPQLHVIGEETLQAGAAFAADIVISIAVSYHVHPSETAAYYANLERLAVRPGARLFFDASISDVPLRNRSWCWPLDFYKQSLPGLTFIGMDGGTHRAEGANFSMGVLEFRRPQ